MGIITKIITGIITAVSSTTTSNSHTTTNLPTHTKLSASHNSRADPGDAKLRVREPPVFSEASARDKMPTRPARYSQKKSKSGQIYYYMIENGNRKRRISRSKWEEAMQKANTQTKDTEKDAEKDASSHQPTTPSPPSKRRGRPLILNKDKRGRNLYFKLLRDGRKERITARAYKEALRRNPGQDITDVEYFSSPEVSAHAPTM
jgi:hypothetical protein